MAKKATKTAEETPLATKPAGNGTALALTGAVAEYAIMKIEPGKLAQTLRANTGPRGLREFDLDRVTVPTGGGRLWSVPSLRGQQSEEALEGIILHFQDGRAYYKEEYEKTGGGTPPDCVSIDLEHGSGDPGGECAQCPFAAFGSKEKGGVAQRGQACGEHRVLFMIRKDNIIPMVIKIPPTSLGEARKFGLRLASSYIPYFAVVTRLTLVPDRNKSGISFSKVQFAMVEQLPDEAAKRVAALAAVIAPQMKEVMEKIMTEEPAEK